MRAAVVLLVVAAALPGCFLPWSTHHHVVVRNETRDPVDVHVELRDAHGALAYARDFHLNASQSEDDESHRFAFDAAYDVVATAGNATGNGKATWGPGDYWATVSVRPEGIAVYTLHGD